jgi:tRNA (guanine-N7-)-methyltransferase
LSDEARVAGQWRLYGRSRGHKLRQGRQALFDRLLPALTVTLPDTGPLDPARAFGRAPKALWLEVGFGGGEHLAHQAAANPSVSMIGCEPFIDGVATLLTRIESERLGNIRLFPDDGRVLLDHLPDACLDRAFVLFSDPWPKKRHNKRRFIGRETVDTLARCLKDGAELRFASDDMSYIDWTLGFVTNHPAFAWTARRPADWRERPADACVTRYEAKALKAGKAPVYLSFLRRPR